MMTNNKIAWGPPHHYPDGGRRIWLDPSSARSLRAEIKAAWKEVSGCAYGDAHLPGDHPILRRVEQMMRTVHAGPFWLVFLESVDGCTVHIGGLTRDRADYVLSG
jgi:hypothetical protein